jgi:hypothetical protein
MDKMIADVLIAAIMAIAAVTFTIRYVSKRKSKKIVQSRNIVGGDMAGRDINKKG